jgi:hypothetical protein
MKVLAALAPLALAGCATLEQPPDFRGAWGGPHIGLSLDTGLGTVEYDCASGTIDESVLPGPDGRFQVRGTHREGQGGPVRVGQIFRSQRATYTGQVVKDSMTLEVKLEDGTELGPFALARGAPPQITRCL